MKDYSIFLTVVLAAVACSSLPAEKEPLQPTATVVDILQGSAGKCVERHFGSGEKVGGKVAKVMDNVVHLCNLAGVEYFDAVVDVKDICAVLVGVAGR
jgi:hypothetical protein